MKFDGKIHLKPGHIPLSVLKFGLPPVILVLCYILYCGFTAEPNELIYITRELYAMLEHALMSLAILFGGATALEAVTRRLN